jgi:hypothetical protein
MTVSETNRMHYVTTPSDKASGRVLAEPTVAQQAECWIRIGLHLAELTSNGLLTFDESAIGERRVRSQRIIKLRRRGAAFTEEIHFASPEWDAAKRSTEMLYGSRDCWACGQASGAVPPENQDRFGNVNQDRVYANHLHHLTYHNFGSELAIDCVFLCETHHKLVHRVAKLDGLGKPLAHYTSAVKAAIEVGGGDWKAEQIPL